MNRNVKCESCGKNNQIINIEKYFGKKARIYCLNSACNKGIILDLTNEVVQNDNTHIINNDSLHHSVYKLIYENKNVENQALNIFICDNVVGRLSSNEMKADLVVSGDPYLSRRQFILRYKKDGYTISDCNSKNKTLLNGKELCQGEEIYLIEGDIISAGQTTFKYIKL